MHKTWGSILNSSPKKNRSDARLKSGQVQGQTGGDVLHCLYQLHSFCNSMYTASCCVSQRVGLNDVGAGQLCCACRWLRREDVWWKHLGDAALPSFFSAEFSGSDLMPPSGALCEVCNVLDFKCYIYYQQPVMWWPCLLWQLLYWIWKQGMILFLWKAMKKCFGWRRAKGEDLPWCTSGAKCSVQGIKRCLNLLVYVVGSLRRYQMAETVDGNNQKVRFFLYNFFGEILQSFLYSSSSFTADIHHSVGYILFDLERSLMEWKGGTLQLRGQHSSCIVSSPHMLQFSCNSS